MATINYKVANRDVQDSFNKGQQEDLTFPASALRQGANLKPSFDYDRIGYLFPQNDESAVLFGAKVMSHTRLPDTDVQPHVHFKQDQVGQPIFVLEYKWYNPHEQVPSTFTTMILDETVFGYTSGEIAEIAINSTNSYISGIGKGEASVFEFRLYRQSGDGYTGDVLFTEFDIHYFASRFGKDVI